MMIRQGLLIATVLLTAPGGALHAADAAAIYAEKCAACHGDMASFAKRSLCLADALPVLRQGGEKLEEFLLQHGRLRPEEIETVCTGIIEHLELPPVK